MRDRRQEHYSPAERSLLRRRDFLMKAGSGLGALALTSLLAEDGWLPTALGDQNAVPDPLAPKKPHVPPRAASVIWLFMEGGPSHLDTFDPKPTLQALGGQPMPASF